MELKKDYYEIRLESIGGLGANLAGKILGECGALYLKLNSSEFSSYGSEKRGSPVKSFIRFSRADLPIRINSPIEKPDILCIFHNKLSGKEMLMAGVDENTSVIVNTDEVDIQNVRDKLKMYGGNLYLIDALKIAMEKKTRINMVLLGAIAKISGFIDKDKLCECVKNTIGKKYPSSIEANINGIIAGYENVKGSFIKADGKYPYVKYKDIERQWGYENAPIGGINPIYGSTIKNNLSASREGYVPVFDKEKCINCGLCDTTCPDMVFQFKEGIYKDKPTMLNLGPDYAHCKGCLRCVEICPTKALTSDYERNVDLTKIDISNIDLIYDNFEPDYIGQNSWISSESYTTDSLD